MPRRMRRPAGGNRRCARRCARQHDAGENLWAAGEQSRRRVGSTLVPRSSFLSGRARPPMLTSTKLRAAQRAVVSGMCRERRCPASRTARAAPNRRHAWGARGGWAVSDGRAGSGPGDAPLAAAGRPPRHPSPPRVTPVEPSSNSWPWRPRAPLDLALLQLSCGCRGGRTVSRSKTDRRSSPPPSPPSPDLPPTYPHDPPSTAPVAVRGSRRTSARGCGGCHRRTASAPAPSPVAGAPLDP